MLGHTVGPRVRHLAILSLALANACAPGLELDGATIVSCESNDECPVEQGCLMPDGHCVVRSLPCIALDGSVWRTTVASPTALEALATLDGVVLAWQHPDPDATYRVSRLIEGGEWLELGTTPTNHFFYDLVPRDAIASYRVVAASGECTSEPSSSVEVASVPLAAVELGITVPTDVSLQLDWTDENTLESGYRIERRLHGDGAWTEFALLGPNGVRWVDDSVAPDTRYEYSVTALNGDGVGSEAVVVSAWSPVPGASADVVLYEADFGGVTPGETPADWQGFGPDYASTPAADTFVVRELAGNRTLYNGESGINETAYLTDPASAAWSNYHFSGRMRRGVNGEPQNGVIFLAQHPVEQHLMYRLRVQIGQRDYHLVSRGGSGYRLASTGTIPNYDAWYRFEILVTEDGEKTEIGARVWPQGEAAPPAWQAYATDRTGERLTAGGIGMWVSGFEAKYLDDLRVAIPAVLVTIDDRVVAEGEVAALPITLSAPCVEDVVISWSTADVTAIAGEDYQSAGGQLTLPAGVVSAELSIATLTDGESEPAEQLVVQFDTVSPVVVKKGIAFVVIEDPAPGDVLMRESFNSPIGSAVPGWTQYAGDYDTDTDTSSFRVRRWEDALVLASDREASINALAYWAAPDARNWTSYELSGQFFIARANAGVGVLVRAQDPSAGHRAYRIRQRVNTDIHLNAVGFTPAFSGTVDSAVVLEADRWYRFRFRVSDVGGETWLQARIWEVTAAEPAAWQIDATDSSADRLTAGTVGVWSDEIAGAMWDDLVVSVLP